MKQLNILKKLLPYLVPFRLFFLLSIFMATLTVAAALYIPILTGHIIDALLGKGQVDFASVFSYLGQIAAIMLVSALAGWLMQIWGNHICYGVVCGLRNALFEKNAHLPLSVIDRSSHGDFISRMGVDLDQVGTGLLLGFSQLFTGAITIVGTLGFMCALNLHITLVVVLLTPLSILAAHLIAKKSYALFGMQSKIRGELTTLIDETIMGQKVVIAFGQQEQVKQRFDEIDGRMYPASLWATFVSSITNPATRFVNGLVYAGVAVAGGLFVLSGGLTVGQLTVFLSYANQYTKPFNEISGVVAELQNALACAKRVLDLLEEESAVSEVKRGSSDAKSAISPGQAVGKSEMENTENSPAKSAISMGGAAGKSEMENTANAPAKSAISMGRAVGKLEVENLSFSYQVGQSFLQNINFLAKPGQRIAIVGATGCGKTTLINLLMGFYEPDGGRILLDDQDVAGFTKESLRSNYGMVLQETWLKQGSVRENLLMGNPNAGEEELISAAKAAFAHSFIMRLPKGYDTPVGEEGGGISKGQRQLLCIARVLLSHPTMLLLDEATSSIDLRTERKIAAAFSAMMEGKTSIVVAHRLETIRTADLILYMDAGKIVERGRHEELLEMEGAYAQLYRSSAWHGA
ncbi:Rrf2 family transcriptional regulator [Clostridia bacterium]|nr:Rrf2 family transcriptional regulator [Clostridia bacterium]